MTWLLCMILWMHDFSARPAVPDFFQGLSLCHWLANHAADRFPVEHHPPVGMSCLCVEYFYLACSFRRLSR
ncbi:hypothetical protein [Pseudomonas canadensis]|uniref:hypothetical protein n=1 Tax=Pseudomonas canadensis TaxID=915099 RepID=UPI0013781A75|nr:hypothetical protein [Pseudomonas canadensis]